jgi:hypothetical protein
MPSFRGTLSVRLILEGTIIIVAPLVIPLLLDALWILALVFDLATCIFAADDIVQVSIIAIMSLVTLVRWSEATSRVPARTQPVVKLLTSVSVPPRLLCLASPGGALHAC